MSTHIFEYDYSYDPPAPIMQMTIEGIGQRSHTVHVTALVDSGADGTMIPENLLKRIGAQMQDTVQMRGVSGIPQRVKLYDLVVTVGDQAMRVLAVAMPARSEIILGRDVLNRLKITLDGFSSYTTVETLFD